MVHKVLNDEIYIKLLRGQQSVLRTSTSKCTTQIKKDPNQNDSLRFLEDALDELKNR